MTRSTRAYFSLLSAGPRPLDDITARVHLHHDAIAACHGPVSSAIEIRFVITPDGTIPHMFETVAPIDPPTLECVAKALGSAEAKVDPKGEPTDVYLMIAFEVEGTTVSNPPSLPDLATDFEEACSMWARSGALQQSVDVQPKVAQQYFRAHVRHPELFHMAWSIAAADAAARKYIGPALRKRAKPKRCEDPGW